MNKIFAIITFLLLLGAVGFFFGSKNREVEYVVNGEVTSTPVVTSESPAASNVFFGLVPADKLSSIPWYVSRSAALVSYLIMFLVILLGTGMTTGFIYRLVDPVKAWAIHQYLAISLSVTLAIHIISIYFDKFINFTIQDLLVPFVSGYKTLYLSLGIIGFYILLATILISIFLRLKLPKFWRATHYLTYPLFAFSLAHGLFIGSDSATLAMRLVYGLTGAAFLVLLAYRFVIYPLRAKS
jgi:predicted ferric reductase